MTTQSESRARGRRYIAVLRQLNLFLTGAVLAGIPALAAPFGYVTNGNTVSVIDAATNTVVATFPAGGINCPIQYLSYYEGCHAGVAFSPDGAHAYITTTQIDANYYLSGTVAVIDTATNTVTARIPVGTSPSNVSFSPDGAHAYVSDDIDGTVWIIATATNTVVGTLPVTAFQSSVAVTPDEARAYVGEPDNGDVALIDTVTNTLVTTITVGFGAGSVAMAPDGAHLYTAGGGVFAVIDPVSNTVVASVTTNNLPFFNNTEGLALSPDGARAYVADSITGAVSVIDTASCTVLATISVGVPYEYQDVPFALALSPDGAYAYVGDFWHSSVSVISTASNTVITTFPVGTRPQGIAFPPPISVPSSGTTCNGTYNGTYKGNITVSAGQNCRWVGGHLTGNVLVTGGKFASTNATMTGNVAIRGASSFSLGPGSTITGNVGIGLIAPGTATNQICGATVLGDVGLAGNASPFQLGSNSPISCPGNTIGGNATVDLSTAPTAVYNNSIGKSLSCLADGSITGGGNTAAHKLGQCAQF